MGTLVHKHMLISARGVAAPPASADALSAWLTELVSAVNMNLLLGPYSVRCETMGNEGCTGVVCIETSHASLHCWDRCAIPHLKADLYSCTQFDPQVVIGLIRRFRPETAQYLVVNRETGEIEERGNVTYGHIPE